MENLKKTNLLSFLVNAHFPETSSSGTGIKPCPNLFFSRRKPSLDHTAIGGVRGYGTLSKTEDGGIVRARGRLRK